jgi:hypothetical protein
MRTVFGSDRAGGDLLAGCAGNPPSSRPKFWTSAPAMTVGALQAPDRIRTESRLPTRRPGGKRISFAYLGPWNGIGAATSPTGCGFTWRRAPTARRRYPRPGALTMTAGRRPLGAGPVGCARRRQRPLSAVASWGQTGYFELNVPSMLKRMAASRQTQLDFRGPTAARSTFTPTSDTRADVGSVSAARGITDD